jgi:hypothetical protein
VEGRPRELSQEGGRGVPGEPGRPVTPKTLLRARGRPGDLGDRRRAVATPRRRPGDTPADPSRHEIDSRRLELRTGKELSLGPARLFQYWSNTGQIVMNWSNAHCLTPRHPIQTPFLSAPTYPTHSMCSTLEEKKGSDSGQILVIHWSNTHVLVMYSSCTGQLLSNTD